MGKPHPASERKTSHSAVQTQSKIDAIFDRHMAETVVQPGEVSAAMLAERHGVSVDQARAALDKAYRAGELTRRRVTPHGNNPIWVYKPVEK